MAERIGSILVRRRLVTAAELDEALRAQLIYGGRLGTILVELDLLELDDLAEALSEQLRYPVVTEEELDNAPAPALKLLTPEQAQAHQAFPFALEGRRVKMAMASPNDPAVQDALAFITGLRVIPFLVPELRLAFVLDRRYGVKRKERFIRLAPERHDRRRPRGANAPEAEAAPPSPGHDGGQKEQLFGSLNDSQYLSAEDDAQDGQAARGHADSQPMELEEGDGQPELALTGDEMEAAEEPFQQQRRREGVPVEWEGEAESAPDAAPAVPVALSASDVPVAGPGTAPPVLTPARRPVDSEGPASARPAASERPASAPVAGGHAAGPGIEDAFEATVSIEIPEIPAPKEATKAAAVATDLSPGDSPDPGAPSPAAPPGPPPGAVPPLAARPPAPRPPPGFRPPPGYGYPPPPPGYAWVRPGWGPPPPPWGAPPPPPWAQRPPPPAWQRNPQQGPPPVSRAPGLNEEDRLFDEDSLQQWTLRSDPYAVVGERPPADLEEAIQRAHSTRRSRPLSAEIIDRAEIWEFLSWAEEGRTPLEVEADGRPRDFIPLSSPWEHTEWEPVVEDGGLEMETGEPRSGPVPPWSAVGYPEAASSEEGAEAPGTAAAAVASPVEEPSPTALPATAPTAAAAAQPAALSGGDRSTPANESPAEPAAGASGGDSSAPAKEPTAEPVAAAPAGDTSAPANESPPEPAAVAPASDSEREVQPVRATAPQGQDTAEPVVEAPPPAGPAADPFLAELPQLPAPPEEVQTATAGPAVPAVPEPADLPEGVRGAVERASSVTEISSALLQYCADRFGRAFLLVEDGGSASVWRGVGDDTDDPELFQLKVPLDVPSALRAAASAGRPIHLEAPEGPMDEQLFAQLSPRSPYLVLAAVSCQGAPVAFVYAESALAPLSPDEERELKSVVELAGRAHDRLRSQL